MKEKLDIYIKRGEQIISPEKELDWFSMVVNYLKKSYGDKYIESALDIMESLEKYSIEDVTKEFLNKNYEYNFARIVLNIVLNYSKKGPEFIENVMGDDLSYNDLKAIEEIKAKNAQISLK